MTLHALMYNLSWQEVGHILIKGMQITNTMKSKKTVRVSGFCKVSENQTFKMI